MGVGDAVVGLATIATVSYYTISPGAGNEWIVHNVYHEGACELYICTSASTFKFESDVDFGIFAKYSFHLTSAFYLAAKNTEGSSKMIAYDGIQTK